MRIYALYDKVAKRYISTTMAETDDMFVRTSITAILMDYPLKDVECYCVGLIDVDSGIIKPCIPRLVSWDCYKFPISQAQQDKFMSLDDIEKFAQNKKHEFLQKNKDKIEDVERYLSQLKAQLAIEENKPKKEIDKKRIKDLRNEIKNVSNTLASLKEVA